MHTRLRTPLHVTSRGRLVTGLVLVSALVLPGCSTPSDEEPDAQAPAGSGAPADPAEPVEFVFLNQSRGQEETLTALAAEYSEQAGVGVTVETSGQGNWVQDLQSRVQADNLPCLYSATDAFEMAPYIDAGLAMDLSGELEGEWGETFDPAAIEQWQWAEGNNLDIPAGTYSAHWETYVWGLYAAEETSGIDPEAPPQTMSEFITTLQENDAQFAIAASQAPRLLMAYASGFMTDEELEATLAGEASWETDAWRDTFQVLLDLRDAGVLAGNEIPGGPDDNSGVEQSFFSVRDVVAILDGPFGVGVQRETSPEFTQYFTTGVPVAEDATEEARAVARRGRGAVVNPDCEHLEEALAFVRWLTEPEQQQVFATEVGMIPTSSTLLAEPESIAPELEGFAEIADDAQSIPGAFMTADVSDAMSRVSQSIVLGELSIDEALADIQSVQERSGNAG